MAISRPPIIERFFRKWMSWFLRAAGSDSFQNWWPAAVVGTREPARMNEEMRGTCPVATAVAVSVTTAPLSKLPV